MVYTNDQLDVLLDRLPSPIKETLATGDVLSLVKKVQVEFTLSETQVEILSAEIFDLLTGQTNVKDFVGRVKTECETSEELATRIVSFLYEELFDDIAEEIGQANTIRQDYDKELERGEAANAIETRTANQTIELAKEYKAGLSKDDPKVIQGIQTIGTAYGLHVDQTGMLLDEIELVFKGNLSPKDFIGHITARLNISHNLATHIAKDVNDKIFEPIRQDLIDMYEKTKERRKMEGANDENVGYIVDLDNEDHMRIVNGTLQAAPKKINSGITFIPSKLQAMMDTEYETKKRTTLEKISPNEWEFGGTPIGGSLLAAREIATSTQQKTIDLPEKMMFRGMPTEEEVKVYKTEEEMRSPKKEVPPVVIPAKVIVEPVKVTEKPSQPSTEKKSPSPLDAIKSYTIDPYREQV